MNQRSFSPSRSKSSDRYILEDPKFALISRILLWVDHVLAIVAITMIRSAKIAQIRPTSIADGIDKESNESKCNEFESKSRTATEW